MAEFSDVDEALVERLVEAQFPQWADKPVARLHSAGVDNLLFRLGQDLVVRLPREGSVEALRKEQSWAPRLAPQLPLAAPALMGVGRPSEAFPWPWSINGWIEGGPAQEGCVADWRIFAEALAAFMAALQRLSPAGGPAPGEHNFWRGVGLRARDRLTREAIAALGSRIDATAALAAWASDSAAEAWSEAPRWIHGDLHGQNLLLRDGHLHAVIDFGCLGVGDPACDLAVAWRLLPREARPAFLEAIQADADSCRRGRAWALSISLRELCVYGGTAPKLEAIANRTVAEVLREHGC